MVVFGRVVINSKTRKRELAESSFGRNRIRKVLKHHKFPPHKIHLAPVQVSEHNAEDFDRRPQFCENIS